MRADINTDRSQNSSRPPSVAEIMKTYFHVPAFSHNKKTIDDL